MRELTLALNEIAHPQTLPDGSSVWVEGGIREKLQNGDPAMGWPGDPRLEVYLGPDERLYVWRLENDGQYRMVCRSAPGVSMDERLIRHLQGHDTRRGFDPKAAVDAHNAGVDRALDEKHDAMSYEASERLAWGLQRDIGHLVSGLSRRVF